MFYYSELHSGMTSYSGVQYLPGKVHRLLDYVRTYMAFHGYKILYFDQIVITACNSK